MTKAEYVSLYEKCASGKASDAEITALKDHQDQFSLDEVLWDTSLLGNEQMLMDEIYGQVSASIHQQNDLQRNKRKSLKLQRIFRYAAAAAIVFIFILSGLYFSKQRRYDNKKSQSNNRTATTTIAPGGQHAILTLADGSEIMLGKDHKKLISQQGAATIRREGGRLIYDLSKQTAVTESDQPVPYNSLKTPRGAEYELVLPDGTHVWLNAASTIRFPAIFKGSTREVELEGEAYFEVAHQQKKPFHVVANGTLVEVLGTHFNVSAYTKQVATTLLEGSVRLRSGGQQVLLRPGQSGTKENNGFQVHKADTEAIMAWKNGYFVFHDENIRSIMDKVSRWYDVDVEYLGEVADKEFYGKVSRYKDVSELLKNLELTKMIHFKIIPGDASGKGRRIIVMP